MAEQDLPQWLQAPWLAEAVLVAAALIGLALWLLGLRLAKPLCGLAGVLLGAAAGGALIYFTGPNGLPALWIAGGAAVGLLAALLLFRFWVALSLALVLALFLAGGTLIWRGVAAPVDVGPAAAEALYNDLGEPHGREAPPTPAERLDLVARQQLILLQGWWLDMPAGVHRTALIMASLGCAVGLLIGMLRPRLAASMETALIGSLLLLLAVSTLVHMHLPSHAHWLPRGAPAAMAALGLITTLGILVQWTLAPRKTDK